MKLHADPCPGLSFPNELLPGNGRSRVEPLKESKLRKPELHELPTLASAFHEQLKKVFGTS